MRVSPLASWAQRHRLGQIRAEAATGIYRPHHPKVALRLFGKLDLPALRAAWRRVQERHSVLLCGFDLEDGTWRLDEPAEPTDITLVETEAADCTVDAVALVEQLADAPFDFEHGPLARLIVAPATDVTLFVLVVDHVVADFWSLDVLMRDLTTCYDAELGLPTGTLPAIPLPYPEQVRRQNAYLESPQGRRALHHVTEGLKDLGPVPATHMAGFTGATSARYDHTGLVRATLDSCMTRAVFSAARRARMSPWSLIHAAVHAALHDLTDQPAVGTMLMTANRESESVHQTVGFLASKVVVATGRDMGAGADTAKFLKDFQRAVIGALDSTEIPWPRIIAAMEPESFGCHSRVPYISFNPQVSTMRRWVGNWQITGCETAPLDLSGSTPDAAIIISLTEQEKDVSVTLYHRSDWYPAHAVENFWATVDRKLRTWLDEAGVDATP